MIVDWISGDWRWRTADVVVAMERGPLSLEEEEHMIELAAMTTGA